MLNPFYSEHPAEFRRVMTCILFLPESRLRTSPYADLASPAVHTDLEPLFAKEYCAHLGMSKQVPLRVVGDIGGGGALARIEKGRKVMRERKSEWSQTDELPVSMIYKQMSPLVYWCSGYRLKYPSRQKTATTLFSLVPSLKSSQLNQILPWWCHVAMS